MGSTNEEHPTWITVTPEIALGDRLRQTTDMSAAASEICHTHKNPRKNIELIGDEPCQGLNILTMRGNVDMLRKLKQSTGAISDVVSVAKVSHPSHPAFILANLCTEIEDAPGFTLYANKKIPKGTILGNLVGTIMLGSEADKSINNEQDGKGKMREAAFFDLEGSLKLYGGWVFGDRTTENAEMLVLDTSQKSNILSLLTYDRLDLYKNSSRHQVRGTANVKYVQLRVSNLPKIVVVSTMDIPKDAELMSDVGKNEWESIRNIYNAAKHLYDLQKVVNELTDRNTQLEDENNLLTAKQREDNDNVKAARKAALQMAEEWKEMEHDENGLRKTIKKEKLGIIIPTHLIGSLRSEVYEEKYGDDDDEDLKKKISEHQELVYNNKFRPKKVMEKEMEDGSKKNLSVDNPDCEEYMEIQAKDGPEIFHEVGRAWQEYQDLYHETPDALIPWNNKRKRMLENDEVIMTQHAKCMVLAGYKPCSESSSGDNEEVGKIKTRFRQIFKELKKRPNEVNNEPDKEAVKAANRAMSACGSGVGREETDGSRRNGCSRRRRC